jgi:phosphoenolpyruvate carboxylase
MAAMSLSDNVQLLGRTLGQVLSEQEGPAFLALVEQVRALVRQVRAGEDDAPLRGVLAGADRDRAEDLVRAFTLYFQLVNRAEEHERVRRLTGALGPRTQTLELALRELQAMGMTAEQVEALIARRGPRADVHGAPDRDAAPDRARAPRRGRGGHPRPRTTAALERVAAHVEALWRTPELRRLRPTVQDEVKGGLSYVQVIARALPELRRGLSRAFRAVFGRDTAASCRSASRAGWAATATATRTSRPEATRDALQLHRERRASCCSTHIREAYARSARRTAARRRSAPSCRRSATRCASSSRWTLVARLDALDARLRARRPGAQRRPAARAAAHDRPGCSGGTSSASTCASTAR